MADKVRKTKALESLTAQYSDSEEEEQDEELDEAKSEVSKSSQDNESNQGSAGGDDEDEDDQDLDGITLRDKLVSQLKASSESRGSQSGSPAPLPATDGGADQAMAEGSPPVAEEREMDEYFDANSSDLIDLDEEPIDPIEYHRGLVGVDPEELKIPPLPTGRCCSPLERKIRKLYEMKKEGEDMNKKIHQRKDFRNPSIYEKLIAYCDIDELGTNLPPETYDPQIWGPDSFYEQLALRQKVEMERREKERRERGAKVEFIMGTAKKPSSTIPTSSASASAAEIAKSLSAQAAAKTDRKRASKWDVSSSSQPSISAPPVVTLASGTKSTVISAFGSIKRPKV